VCDFCAVMPCGARHAAAARRGRSAINHEMHWHRLYMIALAGQGGRHNAGAAAAMLWRGCRRRRHCDCDDCMYGVSWRSASMTFCYDDRYSRHTSQYWHTYSTVDSEPLKQQRTPGQVTSIPYTLLLSTVVCRQHEPPGSPTGLCVCHLVIVGQLTQ